MRTDFTKEVRILCANDSLYTRDQSIMQSKIAVLEAKVSGLEAECDSLDQRIARNYIERLTGGR